MTETSSHTHRSLALLIALVFDWIFGEPPAWAHPVVWLGKLIDLLTPTTSGTPLTGRGRKNELRQGTVIFALTILAAYVSGRIVDSAIRRLPTPLGLLASAIALKPAFAVQSLVEASLTVETRLQAGDLAGARSSLTALVSRDVDRLDQPLVAAGAIESLAENLSDSFVAPAGYYLLLGLPGAFAYRAANTLDSMIGYRGPYEYLGKTSAQADDLANVVPSRLSAGLVAVAAALDRQDWSRSLLIALRDHQLTASPNAGWPMSAMAGALNLQLEKPDAYRLGAGFRKPRPADISRAARVTRLAVWLCWILAAIVPVAFRLGKCLRTSSPSAPNVVDGSNRE